MDSFFRLISPFSFSRTPLDSSFRLVSPFSFSCTPMESFRLVSPFSFSRTPLDSSFRLVSPFSFSLTPLESAFQLVSPFSFSRTPVETFRLVSPFSFLYLQCWTVRLKVTSATGHRSGQRMIWTGSSQTEKHKLTARGRTEPLTRPQVCLTLPSLMSASAFASCRAV